MNFGEDPGEAIGGERKARIKARKLECEAHRENSIFEAAENNFHPRNPGAIYSTQAMADGGAVPIAASKRRLDGNEINKSSTVGGNLGLRPSVLTSGRTLVDHPGQGLQALTVDSIVHSRDGNIVTRPPRQPMATKASERRQRRVHSAPPMTRD